MAIIWKDEYNLGIEIIDKQHHKFVETLNLLFEAINRQEAKEKLQEVFKGLDDYINFHFQTEEKYFDEFNYDGSAEHKAKHQEFREKMQSFKNQIAENEMEISFSLIDYLEDWLVNHLADMDKKYVSCFKDHGLF
jgi:hemerythrin